MSLSSLISAGLPKNLVQLLALMYCLPSRPHRIYFSLMGPFCGEFNSLSLSCFLCPLLAITVFVAISGLRSILWRTAKEGNEDASADRAVRCGPVVPAFASAASEVLEVTFIFIGFPRPPCAHINAGKISGLAVQVEAQGEPSGFVSS